MELLINGKKYAVEELLNISRDPIARAAFGDCASAKVIRNGRPVEQGDLMSGIRFPNRIKMRNIGFDGIVKWENECNNLVTNVGLQHILDILFVSATAQIDPWYVMLIADNSAATYVVAGDTMGSHAGWSEDVNYSDANRITYVDVRSSESVDNSASTADFSINGTATIAGAALTSDNTKSGTSGTLLCGGTFTGGDRAVINGDTLQVTYTFTAADDGA